VGDGVRTLHSKNANVFQIRPRDSPANTTHPTEQAFDPEKIVIRILRRDRNKECSVTAAQINLHWGLASEDFAKIQVIDN
jgi:hypothetical protein